VTGIKNLAIALGLVFGCHEAPTETLAPVPPGPVMDQVRAILARDSARWIDVRRDLHRRPEVSGAEARTAGVVAGVLRSMNFEVRTGVGGHGVVGVLRGGRPGPLVAYRADMDAVPSTAPDPVEFPSLNAGIRHICGHDVHTTIGLALATALHQVRDSLAGSVMFIFQPAEETATGANAMLAAGVFASATPTAIFGVHAAPFEAGLLSIALGPMMAGRDRFTVTLTGTGDLNAAASAVTTRILALNTMDASQLGIGQPPDMIFTQMTGQQASAGSIRVSGTVTVASAASRARVRQLIESELGGALPAGVAAAASYEAKWIAGVTNDSAVAATARDAVRATLGDANMLTARTVPPGFSEDFGSFQERVPGAFFFLGVSNASRGWRGLPHDANFVADERAIGVGALAMAGVIVERLRIR
jgi:amidohydrolase